MKILAARSFRKYLSDTTNVFDFVVVLTSSPTLLQPMLSGSIGAEKGGLGALSAVRIIRLFRIFRIARLLHKVQSMRRLLAMVFHSMSAIMHLSIFIMFTIVTASILATNLFSRPYPPSPDVAEALNSHGYSIYAGGAVPRWNFDTVPYSLITLFNIMTGKRKEICWGAGGGVATGNMLKHRSQLVGCWKWGGNDALCSEELLPSVRVALCCIPWC